jgi:hypothetical protein
MYKQTLKYYPRLIREHSSADDFIDNNGLRNYYQFLHDLSIRRGIAYNIKLSDDKLCLITEVIYNTRQDGLEAENELHGDPVFSDVDNVAIYITKEDL